MGLHKCGEKSPRSLKSMQNATLRTHLASSSSHFWILLDCFHMFSSLFEGFETRRGADGGLALLAQHLQLLFAIDLPRFGALHQGGWTAMESAAARRGGRS